MHGNTGEPCTLFVSVTQDLGNNWSDPANGIVAAGTTGPNVCQDKEHIAVDRANNDNVYVAWTPVGGANNWEAIFSRDLNGISDGLAFSAPAILSTGAALDGCLNQGADFALDGAGNIYVVWTSFCSGFADGNPGTVYVVRSSDQGAIWTAPVQAATLVNVDLTALSFRTRSHPSIAADPVTGRVFVVYGTYADSPTNTDPDIMIVSSPDGTTGSWTGPIRVNQDLTTTEQFLPWIAVGNGRIHVNFHSRAADGSNIDMQLAYGSVSASPTFTEIRVSSASTPPMPGFLGDYTGNFVGSDDVVHPAWGDARSGVGGATDAFTARVNFSPPTTLDVQPAAPVEQVGNNILFEATVTGAHDEAETFIPVTFAVMSAGAPSSPGVFDVTDGLGKVPFTYTNTVSGMDTLHVFADFDEDGVEDSGETADIIVTWLPGPPETLDLVPSTDTNTVDDAHMVTAEVQDLFGNAVPDVLVRFTVSGANGVFGIPTSGSATTDAAGMAAFSYVGPMPGMDTVTAFADFNEDGVRDPDPAAHEPQDTAEKTWELPESTPGKATGGGFIILSDGERATFGFVAQFQSGAASPKGELTFQIHSRPPFRLKSMSIDAIVVSGATAKVFGTATAGGSSGVVFRLDLTDNGEPGRKADTFRLRTSDGLDSGIALLQGGNIQISP